MEPYSYQSLARLHKCPGSTGAVAYDCRKSGSFAQHSTCMRTAADGSKVLRKRRLKIGAPACLAACSACQRLTIATNAVGVRKTPLLSRTDHD